MKVRALPGNLPERFEVSIDGLADFETSLHVRDLVVPADVTLLTDPDEMVVRILAPRVEAPTAAETAEAEAAEAASAEAETPAAEG